MKRLLLAALLLVAPTLAWADETPSCTLSEGVNVCSFTFDGNENASLKVGGDWKGGITFTTDGDDGGGTITIYFSADGGTTYTAVTDTSGTTITCAAACSKTVYQEGMGAITNIRATMAGGTPAFTAVSSFSLTRRPQK